MSDQQHGNDPNKGMNTKLYMIAVIVATLVILSAIFFFVAGNGKRDIPKANQPHPNSELILPVSPATASMS